MSEDEGQRQNGGSSGTRTVMVTNRDGLHARPSLTITETVRKYQADVTIRKGDRRADGSSILDLLSLGAPKGTELVLSAAGPDAEEVLEALVRLFADEFGVSYTDEA